MVNKKLKRMSSEQIADLLREKLTELFKSNNLSGIIEIPNHGTFGIFKDDTARLKILNHCQIELKKKEIEIEQSAKKWLRGEYEDEKESNPKPSYTG